ncbi:MAG: methyl-accepting chemotaxis protein [Termitinemataceae bacterium]
MTSCNTTEALLRLVKLCDTAHKLDENVHTLESLAEEQSHTVTSVQSGIIDQVTELQRILESQDESSQKLLENSNLVIEWLTQEAVIQEQFTKNTAQLQSVWTKLKEIAPSVDSMRNAIGSINEIFDLLHILSINTAIEAAKFGERGKAFSIIAKEMRSLADRSRSYIENVRTQADSVFVHSAGLVKGLASAIQSYTELEQTMTRFLGDSTRIRDNTRVVMDVIEQYRSLSRGQIQEWHSVIHRIEDLANSASVVLARSQHIQEMADVLFTMTQEEAATTEECGAEIVEQATGAVAVLAFQLSPSILKNKVAVDQILLECSDTHEIFELLYVLDAYGFQISGNIYAERYRHEHDDREGFGVDRAQKEYFMVPKQQRTPYISAPYFSTATRALCITVSLPLVQGNILYGVVCADIDLRHLAGVY